MARMLDVLDRLRDLETDLEHEVAAAQHRWHYKIETGRIRFEEAVHRRHKALKMSLAQFLRESSIPALLTAPIIYSLFVPFVVVDAWVSLYQLVCFFNDLPGKFFQDHNHGSAVLRQVSSP